MPYCAAHALDARRFDRYAAVFTVAAAICAGLLLLAFDLTAGRALRATGSAIWWCSTVLFLALLFVGAAGVYAIGRRLLQRRYPALAGHYYTGSLGVRTRTYATRHPPEDPELLLAITFTFASDAFAAQVAALHGVGTRRVRAPDDAA